MQHFLIHELALVSHTHTHTHLIIVTLSLSLSLTHTHTLTHSYALNKKLSSKVSEQLRDKISEFKAIVPNILDLGNPNMRTRYVLYVRQFFLTYV